MNTALHQNAKAAIALALALGIALLGLSLPPLAGAQTLSGTVTAGTATSTRDADERIAELEEEVDMLKSELATLKLQFQAFMGVVGTSTTATTTTGGGSGSTATSSQWIRITPENASPRAGTSIDFNGRGFWADEQVTVMRDAEILTVAKADSAGNFSTGSIPVPWLSGTYTYTFRGDWSGMTGAATVDID